MPIHEVLVLNRTGLPVSYHSQGHAWKRGELTNQFTIVPVDLTMAQLRELLSLDYTYDPASSTMFSDADGDEFDPAAGLDASDAPERLAGISETIATILNPNWRDVEPDVCKFLHAPHLPVDAENTYDAVRRYWFRRFRRLRARPGMRRFMAAALFRDYGVISVTGHNLPLITRRAVFNRDIFTEQDKDWLAWLWRVGRDD